MKKTILLLTIMATIGLVSAQVKISKQGINLSQVNEPYIDGIDFTQYVDQDTATQNLTLKNNSQQTNDLLKLSNSSSVLIKDDYEPNTDNQNLSINYNTEGQNDTLNIDKGNSVILEDKFEKDTNISDDQNLSEVLNEGNKANTAINLNQNNINGLKKIYSDNSNTGFFQGGAKNNQTISGIDESGNLLTTQISVDESQIKPSSVRVEEINSNIVGNGLEGGASSPISVLEKDLKLSDFKASNGSAKEYLRTDGNNPYWSEINLSSVIKEGNNIDSNGIDMNGNSIKSSNGEICIGEYC